MKKVFTALICAIMVLGMAACSNKDDNTKLSNSEVVELLEKKGYKFNISDEEETHYVYFTNINKDDESYIWVQKYDNTYVGTNYTFSKEDVNEKHANIIDKEENDSKDEKLQYDAYLDWLNEMGLKKSQIINVLDYYDKKHTTSNTKSDDSSDVKKRLINLGYKLESDDESYIIKSIETFGDYQNVGVSVFNLENNTFATTIDGNLYLINWKDKTITYKTGETYYTYNTDTHSWVSDEDNIDAEIKVINIFANFLKYLTANKIYLNNFV
ncbi:MAG: hypothetical protein KH431_08865 [Erysipelotrichaceae bacterium]|nr:hypothetical protein [Erysipelotrichaceae bacterium]